MREKFRPKLLSRKPKSGFPVLLEVVPDCRMVPTMRAPDCRAPLENGGISLLALRRLEHVGGRDQARFARQLERRPVASMPRQSRMRLLHLSTTLVVLDLKAQPGERKDHALRTRFGIRCLRDEGIQCVLVHELRIAARQRIRKQFLLYLVVGQRTTRRSTGQ